MVRMEWTMDEFFNNGGTTKFIDRVAGSLGIHASTIKIVSVYEGSVVLNYDIVPDENEANPQEALKRIHKVQTKKFSTGKMDLGAPILDVQAKQVVATDETPATESAQPTKIISGGKVASASSREVLVTTNDNNDNQAESTFVPDIPILQVNHEHVTNIDKHVETTEYVTQVNKWETDEVFETVEDKQIQIIQGNDNTAVLIIVIAAGVLVLLFLLFIARFLHNKLRIEKLRAEEIRITQQNLNSAAANGTKIKVVPRGKNFQQAAYTKVGADNGGDKVDGQIDA